MCERIQTGSLQVARVLHDFINEEALPGTGVDEASFWSALEAIIDDLAPRNRALLAKRDELQARIDAWYHEHQRPFDLEAYKSFLREIGYLVPEGEDFSATTQKVDPEISTIAGPQLVVPVMNARYALNAANARWGSLYDALYGTDAIADEGAARGPGYNPERGARVLAFVHDFLDEVAPLAQGSHRDARGFAVEAGRLVVQRERGATGLKQSEKFAGYQGDAASPSAVLLVNHGLHIEIRIDRSHLIGKDDPAGVADVVLEAAVTTIMDCEDSIAAVDAEDKVAVYRNWLGLMQGHLATTLEKGGMTIERRLNPDRSYTAPDGGTLTLPGRSLMLVRNVGHLMTSDAVLDRAGNEVPEGILDGVITALIAIHDLQGSRPPSQQPRGLRLHRQAQDARARGGGVHERAVRPHRGCAGPRARHAQDRHHGRGAAHHGQSQGVHPRRARSGVLHQHGLPRSHRRRDPHRHGGGRHDPQGRHEGSTLDPGLRGLERRCRPRLRPAGPRPDRQGHVGDAGQDGGHAGGQDRPSASRRQHRVGPLADRRRPARHALPQGRRRGPPGRAEGAAAREPRRHPRGPGGGASELAARTRCSASSTTTPRAFSATSCAGSIRAWGARRCPTSTMWA